MPTPPCIEVKVIILSTQHDGSIHNLHSNLKVGKLDAIATHAITSFQYVNKWLANWEMHYPWFNSLWDTNERFLPAWSTFRVGLASESHWSQPVLVLTIHW